MYDYTSRASLSELAGALERKATDSHKACLCAFALSEGLMRPRGFALWLMCKVARMRDRNGRGFSPLVATLYDGRLTEIRDQMWRQTLDWLVAGKDSSDLRSAGGWNGEELARFVGACQHWGLLPQVAPQPDIEV